MEGTVRILRENALIDERLKLDLAAAILGIGAGSGACGEPPSGGIDYVAVCRNTKDDLGGRKAGRGPGIVTTDGILGGLRGVAASVGERGIRPRGAVR